MALSKLPPVMVVRAIETLRHCVGVLHRRMLPAPTVMMEMILGTWAAQAITAAADLKIADALADGPLTAQELASATGADADTLSRLLRALISRGVFRQRRDGRYDLTPLGDTLRTDAEVSVAAFAQWLGAPQHREHWSHFTDSVRTGRAVVPEMRGKPAFEYLADEPELGEIFNAAMTSGSEFAIASVMSAYDFSPYPTIVDVGGGHGRLLAAILHATPGARGVLFDLPQVVAGAPAELSQHGVEDRVQIVEGSFFDSVPAGGDAYVLKNIIHDWPDDDAVRILSNIRAAAEPGTTVLMVEMVIPEHGREFLGKWVDLEMLVVAAARERTAAEYRQLFDRSGFRLTRIVATVSAYSVVVAEAV